jgi:hypothetical protein|tara:strand:- start:956 stop:1177 length:222 start_codon:yes stop_codon:yes gene_type:complete
MAEIDICVIKFVNAMELLLRTVNILVVHLAAVAAAAAAAMANFISLVPCPIRPIQKVKKEHKHPNVGCPTRMF